MHGQSVMLPETTNHIVGTTLNPWNIERTPGGSSGGKPFYVRIVIGALLTYLYRMCLCGTPTIPTRRSGYGGPSCFMYGDWYGYRRIDSYSLPFYRYLWHSSYTGTLVIFLIGKKDYMKMITLDVLLV